MLYKYVSIHLFHSHVSYHLYFVDVYVCSLCYLHLITCTCTRCIRIHTNFSLSLMGKKQLSHFKVIRILHTHSLSILFCSIQFNTILKTHTVFACCAIGWMLCSRARLSIRAPLIDAILKLFSRMRRKKKSLWCSYYTWSTSSWSEAFSQPKHTGYLHI